MVPPGITKMPNESISLLPSSEESGLPRDVYTLLAQANLLRMRGEWDESVKTCMTALRLAPNSSSAQSLLGDIYENQGRFDDAIQWYRMALDANPDSPADQIKLSRLLQRQVPLDTTNASFSVSGPSQAPLLRLRTLSHDPEVALRYTALTASILLLFVVGLAYAAVHRQTALASLGLANREVEVKPVVVPPDVPSSAVPPMTWRDMSEQTLLDTLRSSNDLTSQGVTVEDVQTDPRSQQMTLTIALSPQSMSSRAAVLHNALHTVQGAAALSQSAPLFIVRCLLLPGSDSTASGATLLFAGDFARSALPASAALEPSDDQLQTLFTDIWWSPQISS